MVRRHGRDLDAQALIAFCRERPARFKVPRVIDIVEGLPRTGSEKMQKSALRKRQRAL